MRVSGKSVSTGVLEERAASSRLCPIGAAAVGAVLAFCAGRAAAADSIWNAASGNWSDSSCWTNGEPNAFLYARISNGGTATVDQYGEACYGLYQGYSSSQDGNLRILGGALTIPWWYVGYSGRGMVAQSDGNAVSGGFLALGYNSSASGTYRLSGSGRLYALHEYVGYDGIGLFEQSDGNNHMPGTLNLGYYYGASGTYRLSGGRLYAPTERVGDDGTGLFQHTDGNNVATDNVYLGYTADSLGTYQLGGNGRLWARYLYLGYYGDGNMEHGGSGTVVSNTVYVGTYWSSFGRYRLDGNGHLKANNEYIGFDGPGLFEHKDGNNVINGPLYLGEYADSSGTYRLSGGGRLWVTTTEYVGRDGSGLFQQSGGTNIANRLNIGFGGRFELTGGSARISQRIDSNGILDLSTGDGVLATGGPVKIGNTGLLLLGGGMLEAIDPNLGVAIANDGNVWITSGDHVLESLLPLDPNILRGSLVVAEGATLTATSLLQKSLTVSGTLVIGGEEEDGEALLATSLRTTTVRPRPWFLRRAETAEPPATVPEPATLGLALLGAAILGRRRRS